MTQNESVTDKMKQLRVALEAFVESNVEFLKRHKETTGKSYPSMYDVAPKYKPQLHSEAIWQDITLTARLCAGDAVDLVCWRVAELRHAGYEDVHPHLKVTYKDDGSVITHVQVRINDMIEDPTVILS
jgi:hypothetical protein